MAPKISYRFDENWKLQAAGALVEKVAKTPDLFRSETKEVNLEAKEGTFGTLIPQSRSGV